MDRVKSGRVIGTGAANRPTTAVRPVTGVTPRPMTSTGLQAPKTARGKSAGIKRQVQDKSYWISVLKAKMTELSNEIAVINADNERMTAEQARSGGLKKKAEQVAKELSTLTHELSIYNEFTDRIRMGDTVEIVKEDVESIQADNEELHRQVEESYEERKRLESTISRLEGELIRRKNAIEDVKRRITDPEDIQTLGRLESENLRWTKEVKRLESEVRKQAEKRRTIEERLLSEESNKRSLSKKSDTFLRREIITALDTLTGLERQRDDLVRDSKSLTSTSGTGVVDEKGRLLGQIKRDNREVNAMEERIRALKSEIDDMSAELEAFEDTEGLAKLRELRQKELAMDTFLSEFEETKKKEIDKIKDVGGTVNSLLDKITRMISHVDGLQATSGANATASQKLSGIDRLLDEKRKLELDLNKIDQLEEKIKSEVESLRDKTGELEDNIAKYSDLDKLRSEIDDKSKTLREEKEQLSQQLEQLKKTHQEVSSTLKEIQSSLDTNETYHKIKNIEKERAEILSSNEKIHQNIVETDHTTLKGEVLSDIKKYNQKLQGY